MAYQRILQLTYVDDLLAAMKKLFIQYFEPFVTSFVASLHSINAGKTAAVQASTWDFSKTFERWDIIFDKLLKGLEEKAAQVRSIIPIFPVFCCLTMTPGSKITPAHIECPPANRDLQPSFRRDGYRYCFTRLRIYFIDL